MSNKRHKRTDAEFVMYEPGIDVPRDVTHLLVPPGIKVLPEEVFQGFVHLKEVALSEGLREIRWMAFYDCRSLESVHFPLTLVRIDVSAFYGCTLLATVHVPEGLGEIGDNAFEHCSSLKRISLSSTVTTIGTCAFRHCFLLEVVILVDGIRTIGDFAFQDCALEEIVLPATLTKIGCSAFRFCRLLRMVKLSGGIQLIEGSAFSECNLLNHVRGTPKCLVVTYKEDGDGFDFEFATDGMFVAHSDHDWVVIASECFHSMSAAEASVLEVAIAEILGMQIAWDDWDDIHERLRRLLIPHERWRKEEVTTILELGLWKAEMCRSGGTAPRTRSSCRVTCKAGGIIPNVVPFL